jgi:Mg-chelatase subunit ChlI
MQDLRTKVTCGRLLCSRRYRTPFPTQDSKQIYKQAPLAFEEKTERIARELADQISERRQETAGLECRAEEALLAFRGSMHGQLTTLDRESDIRFEELGASCEALRGDIGKETEVRRKAEGALMEQLRDTVGDVKQLLAVERS